MFSTRQASTDDRIKFNKCQNIKIVEYHDHIRNICKMFKNVNILEFGDDIHIHHEKYI